MKKRTIIPLVLLTLMFSMSLTTITKSQPNDFQDSLPKISATLPVFQGTDGNATLVYAQNIPQRRGAIYTTLLYNNVTIWYSYAGGDNSSAPLLFGDDGLGNLDWDIGELMTYDDERTTLESDGSAYYNYTFFVQSNFIKFVVRYGYYENEYKVPHLITIGPYIFSESYPITFTQLTDIEFNVTMDDFNITEYGLRYREVTPDHDSEFQNVTIPLVANGLTRTSYNASFAHLFEAGTQIEVRSFMVHFDNMTLIDRILEECTAHLVAIVDASPQLSITADSFVNDLNFSLLYSASAPFSNITSVDIDWDDLSGIQTIVNDSFEVVYHLYDSTGEYNISITAYSDILSVTKNFLVLIEQEAPTGIIKVLVDGNLVQPSIGELVPIEVDIKSATFQVSANDTGGSGVWKITVETDEGNLATLEGDNGEITLLFLEYGEHDILMTVYDNSENTYTFTFSVDLIPVSMRTDNPVPFPFGITTIVGLVAIAAIYLKKKK